MQAFENERQFVKHTEHALGEILSYFKYRYDQCMFYSDMSDNVVFETYQQYNNTNKCLVPML